MCKCSPEPNLKIRNRSIIEPSKNSGNQMKKLNFLYGLRHINK